MKNSSESSVELEKRSKYCECLCVSRAYDKDALLKSLQIYDDDQRTRTRNWFIY